MKDFKQKTKVKHNKQTDSLNLINSFSINSEEYNIININSSSFQYNSNTVNLINKVNYSRFEKRIRNEFKEIKVKKIYNSSLNASPHQDSNILNLNKKINILYNIDKYKIILSGDVLDNEVEFNCEPSFIRNRNFKFKNIHNSELKDDFIINDIVILYKEDDPKRILDIINDSTDSQFETIDQDDNSTNEKSGQIFQIIEDSTNETGLSLTYSSYNDKEIKIDYNLHYGKGFKDYYKKLIKTMKERNSGITLFYGIEGGGKSFLIKRLCIDVDNKAFIYLPNSFISEIGTPKFNYILTIIKNNLPDKNVVVVIEDADEYLMNKEDGSLIKNSVMSSISNITDGILTDFYNIQFVLTFNYNSLTDMPKSILRSNRVIAAKKFNKLSIENCNKIFIKYKSKFKTDKELSLAEVFSRINNNESDILLEDLNSNETKLGFKI